MITTIEEAREKMCEPLTAANLMTGFGRDEKDKVIIVTCRSSMCMSWRKVTDYKGFCGKVPVIPSFEREKER